MVFQSDGGIAKMRKLVEAVIRSRNIEPDNNTVTAMEGGAAWAISSGSAAVMIALNPGSTPDAFSRLRMVSPIVKIDIDSNPDLLRRLLELNGTQMPGIAFGLINDEVVLVSERSVRGLDRSEVEEMLVMVGYYADKYDDLLVEEFGGDRVCDLD